MSESERTKMLDDLYETLKRLANGAAFNGASSDDLDKAVRAVLHIVAKAQGKPID